MAACTTCRGKGLCPKCQGSGKTGGIIGGVCEVCRGKKVCISCNGKGRT